ncbi:MAG: RNA-guided endonuclease InsQ/TnpB family protein [Gammaproteobacteria bacterium]
MPEKIMMKTFKFRLAPSNAQADKMAQHAGASRFVWNAGLAYLQHRRSVKQFRQDENCKFARFMTKDIGLAAQFVLLRNDEEFAWLKELSSHAVRFALKRLDIAYQAAFARLAKGGGEAGFPKFHRKQDDESFTIPSNISFAVGKRRLRLEKIGKVLMRPNRGRGNCEIQGNPKMVIVKREGGKWFACIQCEIAAVAPPPHKGGEVGIDMGVDKPFALNTGTIYNPFSETYCNMRRAKNLEAKRRRYQRIMARRRESALRKIGWDGKSATRKSAEQKLGKLRKAEAEEKGIRFVPHYSARYECAKRRAAKSSRQLMHIRKNALHQITSEISSQHGMIFVEDLQIANMTKSAKGTEDAPGKNVAQKSGLNRAILSQGWGIARGMLEYKTEWKGGRLEKISPNYTSQRCSACGHIAKENRQTQARFVCVSCGHAENADINAAKNILALGKNLAYGEKAASARGDGGVSRSMNRETTTILQGRKKRNSPKKQTGIANRVDAPLQNG